MTTSLRVIVRRGEYGAYVNVQLSGLAEGDCYAMSPAVVHNSIVVKLIENILIRVVVH